ncbi:MULTISPECIES: cysteine desulfurase [Roseiflexus]|jgi:cysteine desulfurase/selenocysteine lyase|uniref:Cysteine desulfurase n=1 Tax=Roseiflexus castenholzii (strain DSM 13941 / HLO8) TaxID=383372 RepID=A7NG52_ROSCS|nr:MULTISPECIES: cysteine desulfurase [Roseiflexus]ABU56439.1 cysteine desulfurase, SufS subfamily [Roseiflexus castenholzii DSM 13941]GIV99424.1 MAG: cysteine desulfurase [Roseiflexus sp.]
MTASAALSLFDIVALRREFPILNQSVNGKTLAFLDSAASSQKPRRVIDCLEEYYRRYNANVHRGIYRLSEEATFAFERARGKVARFINARSQREIVFVRNTTEAINLVARSWGDANLRAGDRILLSIMEHHSNLVPWQMLAQRTGAQLEFLPIDGEGRLALDHLDAQLAGVRLVAITQQSNVLGTINPVAEIARRAHACGALVLVDGAQSVPHMPVDVQALDIDFLAFSGHKMCAPTGIGVLWGRRAILEQMPPFLGGGSMIRVVGLHESTYADVPARFEAGTPAIAEAIALGEAVDFLQEIGMDRISAHERELLGYALERLSEVEGLRVYGPTTTEMRGGAVSFTLDGVHPHDVAAVLDSEGIAVRAGHHCAQPLHAHYDIPATTRASFYLYNIPEEVDRLVAALHKARTLFG